MREGEIDIFILAGQSNMAGRGDAADLPAELIPSNSSIRYDFVCSFGADRGYPFSEGGAYHSDGWSDLKACRKHPSTSGEHFGPELSFASAWVDMFPQKQIAVIKHGRGGTRLATGWDPDNPNSYYVQLLNQISEALKALEDEGVPYHIAGFLWMQGEGDTTGLEYAEAYESNLSNLISRLRKDLEISNLPVVIGRIGDGAINPQMVYTDVVRKAQETVAEEDSHAAWVDTDDLPLDDIVHYNAEGLIKLGRRFAKAMAGLME